MLGSMLLVHWAFISNNYFWNTFENSRNWSGNGFGYGKALAAAILNNSKYPQPAFTCSKLTIETLE